MSQILGGMIIGLAVTIMLLFNGRVTGISGILGGLLKRETPDKDWRLSFLGGLLLGGVILRMVRPEAFTLLSSAQTVDYLMAGFLVGFGTILGSGCTSGHGICGISRLSPRSLVATLTFIFSGALGVILFKLLRGEL